MKKSILSLSIILTISLIPVCAFAQQAKRHGHIHLTEELNLTKEQEDKLMKLNENFKKKILKIKSDSMLTQDEFKAKMGEVAQQHKTDMKSIFTHDQYEQLKDVMRKTPVIHKKRNLKAMDVSGKKDSLEALNKEYEGVGHKFHRGKRHYMAYTERRHSPGLLNLSKEQKEQIKLLTDAYRANCKELADKHRASISEVLTPEQQQKVKDRQGKIEKRNKKGHPDNRIKNDDKVIDKV